MTCRRFMPLPETYEGEEMFTCPHPECGRTKPTREAFHELEECQR